MKLGGHPVPSDRIEQRYHRSLALLRDAIRHTTLNERFRARCAATMRSAADAASKVTTAMNGAKRIWGRSELMLDFSAFEPRH